MTLHINFYYVIILYQAIYICGYNLHKLCKLENSCNVPQALSIGRASHPKIYNQDSSKWFLTNLHLYEGKPVWRMLASSCFCHKMRCRWHYMSILLLLPSLIYPKFINMITEYNFDSHSSIANHSLSDKVFTYVVPTQ